MLEQILKNEWLIFYLLAGELCLIFLAQLRTNSLIKHAKKQRIQKKEALKQLKQEVKNGPSEIPVVNLKKQTEAAGKEKKGLPEKKSGYDAGEMAVLQEMMTEFFG